MTVAYAAHAASATRVAMRWRTGWQDSARYGTAPDASLPTRPDSRTLDERLGSMTTCIDTGHITLRSGIRRYSGLVRAREHLKLRIRAWVNGEATDGWIRFLNSDPFFAGMATACPRLIHKIYRPYVTATLTSRQRVSALVDHYSFVRRMGWTSLVSAAIHAPVTIAEFEGKSGAAYRLQLRTGEIMEREGDLVFQLSRDGIPLVSCACSFFPRSCSQLAIGGMQGTNAPDSLERIRSATRDLYGIRPKHLLVKLIAALGHALGCRQMLLVGNRNHAVRRARREGKVHADYDRFWSECGATSRPDGDFDMACLPLMPPDLQRLPSSKRSEARQRYRLLATIHERTLAVLLPSRFA